MIYFSDASDKFGHDQYLHDMLEARPHGRVLCYDPSTKTAYVVARWAVLRQWRGAQSKDEDFLLVNETYRSASTRLWLKGPRAGETEVFLENLPGFPDNITSNGRGTFWLALFTVRNDEPTGCRRDPSSNGYWPSCPASCGPSRNPMRSSSSSTSKDRFVDSFQDPSGKRLFAVTSAFEHDGNLYLGSLVNDRIGKVQAA